jgi:mannose-1-phosphate guanylyltransferase/mannose-6-phosphate isomerase
MLLSVADKNNSQAVKKIVATQEKQKRRKRTSAEIHGPWGGAGIGGKRFKVKRIQVKPKASLSLPMHHHQLNIRIVVKGTAEITNGDKVITLGKSKYLYSLRAKTSAFQSWDNSSRNHRSSIRKFWRG